MRQNAVSAFANCGRAVAHVRAAMGPIADIAPLSHLAVTLALAYRWRSRQQHQKRASHHQFR
jgi:hypothetical protein